jgi:inhibitor of KinA sporulation pathway (predicted exonuclease)
MSSEIFGRYVNVVDVEATCWSGRPPAGQSNEIIEIGVCVLDTTEWRRVGRHRILVRPRRHVNLKQRFAEVFGLPKAVGMSRALELAGLPLEGRQHRGDDDAWNIGALAVEVARRGQSCDTEGSSCPEGGARGVADPVEA